MRLLLAAAMPWLLARGGVLPLVAWCFAAVSDYVDGPLARRYGTTSLRGAVLDNVADVSFVLSGLATAAALGLVSWLTPASIGLSAGAYAVASTSSPRAAAGPSLARSRLGHWAGVANYLCLGVVTAAVAWPDPRWNPMVRAVALATAGYNLAAVAARLISSMSRNTE
jgi:phosphatidylglycerophosphate synthase